LSATPAISPEFLALAGDRAWLAAWASQTPHGEGTLWLGVAVDGVQVIGHSDEGTLVHDVPELTSSWRLGRFHVDAGGHLLQGKLLRDPEGEEVVSLGQCAPTRRAAVAMTQRLVAGDLEDALHIASRHPEAEGVHHLLAQLALGFDDPIVALGLLVADKRAASPLFDNHKIARKSGWTRDEFRARLLHIDLLPELVQAPEGCPWPPNGLEEVQAVGLALRGQATPMAAALSALPDTARAASIRAACAALVGLPADWEFAARRHREMGDLRAANATLTLELRQHDDAPLRWLAGWWAWDEGSRPEAARHWRAAAAFPDGPDTWPDEQLSVEGWRALAKAIDRADLAAEALRRALELDEGEERDWIKRIELLAELGDQHEAADAMRACIHAIDRGAIRAPTLRPWVLWKQLLELSSDEDIPDVAMEAVRDGFLHVETYQAVLKYRKLLDAQRGERWEHLMAVLAPGWPDSLVHLPETSHLTSEDVELTRPAARNRLRRVLDRLREPTGPDRSLLVRGLDPLEHVDPDAAERIAALARAAGVGKVDVRVSRGEASFGASAWPTSPPVILLGVDHIRPGPRELRAPALDHLFAVELAHLRCRHPLMAWEGDGRTVSRVASGGAQAMDLLMLVPGVDHLARIQRLLKVTQRLALAAVTVDKAVEMVGPLVAQIFPPDGVSGGAGRLDAAEVLPLRLHADRIAMLLHGDLAAAVEGIVLSHPDGVRTWRILRDNGLAEVLADPTSPLGLEVTLRLSALVAWLAGS